jgi:hypothetical protein
MAINRVLAPNASHTGPNNLSEIIAQLAALVNDKEQPARISGSYVLQGAFFNVGGVLYLADSNTAISGTASPYVKLTPSGATAAASFVADLTGVTWNVTYKGYYDGSGNLYVFYSQGIIETGSARNAGKYIKTKIILVSFASGDTTKSAGHGILNAHTDHKIISTSYIADLTTADASVYKVSTQFEITVITWNDTVISLTRAASGTAYNYYVTLMYVEG